jgi:hypothetical protein
MHTTDAVVPLARSFFLGLGVSGACDVSVTRPSPCARLPHQHVGWSYNVFFHSMITYGLIFWGNSTSNVQVFKLQKRVVRIMVGAACRYSCKKIFRSLQILPLPSLYIFILVTYIVNNFNLLVLNSDRNTSVTRNSMNLYLPIANLRVFQKGPEFKFIITYQVI